MNLTKRYQAGLVMLLLLAGCGGGGGSSSTPAGPAPAPAPVEYILDTFFSDRDFSGMRALIAPAVADNARASQLLNCTVLVTEDNLCSFNQLPLLGMETSAPSVDEIMSRVLVSHDWMATRMREVLQRMPPELLLTTRGITAIVVSFDVRPSFYWQGTGAIYIDPDRLWLTEEEQATIDTAPDFRADFGNVLQFLMPWRYVQGGAVDIRSLDRSIDSVTLRTAALFYHELAHANDYYPPSQLASIDRSVPMFQAVLTGSRPSTLLSGSLPLTSQLMDGLAGVSFRGVTATSAQTALLAEDVAVEFPPDVASDFYSYASEREDFAMLVEEAMMFYSFGLDRDVAVTELPETLESCSQLIVAWGVRNRIASPAVLPRLAYALESVLPEVADDVVEQLSQLTPVNMRVGEDFCANIVPASSSRSLSLTPIQPVDQLPLRFIPYL